VLTSGHARASTPAASSPVFFVPRPASDGIADTGRGWGVAAGDADGSPRPAQWRLPARRQVSAARRQNRTGKKPAKVASEYLLHRAVADVLDWLLLPPTVWTTIPSGWGRLGPATAGMLRACGLKRGMPDVMIFTAGLVFGIELKTHRGQRSAEQFKMAERLAAVGVHVFVARSVDEVLEILKMQDVPVRSHR